MATARRWRLLPPNPPQWREIFLRLAAETTEGRALAPEFHGNMLTFLSDGHVRDEGGHADPARTPRPLSRPLARAQ